MNVDYDLEMKCRECEKTVRLELRGVSQTLAEVAYLEWDFGCPEHGKQKARPFTVRAIRPE